MNDARIAKIYVNVTKGFGSWKLRKIVYKASYGR